MVKMSRRRSTVSRLADLQLAKMKKNKQVRPYTIPGELPTLHSAEDFAWHRESLFQRDLIPQQSDIVDWYVQKQQEYFNEIRDSCLPASKEEINSSESKITCTSTSTSTNISTSTNTSTNSSTSTSTSTTSSTSTSTSTIEINREQDSTRVVFESQENIIIWDIHEVEEILQQNGIQIRFYKYNNGTWDEGIEDIEDIENYEGNSPSRGSEEIINDQENYPGENEEKSTLNRNEHMRSDELFFDQAVEKPEYLIIKTGVDTPENIALQNVDTNRKEKKGSRLVEYISSDSDDADINLPVENNHNTMDIPSAVDMGLQEFENQQEEITQENVCSESNADSADDEASESDREFSPLFKKRIFLKKKRNRHTTAKPSHDEGIYSNDADRESDCSQNEGSYLGAEL